MFLHNEMTNHNENDIFRSGFRCESLPSFFESCRSLPFSSFLSVSSSSISAWLSVFFTLSIAKLSNHSQGTWIVGVQRILLKIDRKINPSTLITNIMLKKCLSCILTPWSWLRSFPSYSAAVAAAANFKMIFIISVFKLVFFYLFWAGSVVNTVYVSCQISNFKIIPLFTS